MLTDPSRTSGEFGSLCHISTSRGTLNTQQRLALKPTRKRFGSTGFMTLISPEESVLELMGQSGEIKGAERLREKHLRVLLHLHRWTRHDGSRAAEELVSVPATGGNRVTTRAGAFQESPFTCAGSPEDAVDGEAGPEIPDAAQVQREAVVVSGGRDGDLWSRNGNGRISFLWGSRNI